MNTSGRNAEIKLFGVQIAVQSDDGAESSTIRRTKSLGNLQSCIPETATVSAEPSGYLSDGVVHPSSKSLDRKRGKPWSEDEHRSFLAGLEKLGKGDWKGISNNFVPSRTSTQVASHAQKYFNRLSSTEKRRRRASVFDLPLSYVNQASSSKVDETSLPVSCSTNARVLASKNVYEPKEQTKKTAAPVVTSSSERPPLCPINKRAIPDHSHTVAYQQPRFTKGYPTQTETGMSIVSWVPVVNFSGQRGVLLPSIHGRFVPQGSMYGAAAAVQAANNDALNHNIKKLTL